VIQSALLLEADGVRHGFFTRAGGVSGGIYESLNCGVGSNDSRANVLENRSRVLERIGGTCLNTVYQVHGTEVAEATGPWAGEPPTADGAVTATPGVALGILTADCAPVLFADPSAKVIGAAHCGWKGALGGVAERVIERMAMLGARRDRIVAAIGPCIAQTSYEVTTDFRQRFLAEDKESWRYFADGKPGHAQFDLPGYVAQRLRDAGIAAFEWTAQDTYTDEGSFFSYRRATHLREPDYGRQVSVICLAA
jgi:YfiH family protein